MNDTNNKDFNDLQNAIKSFVREIYREGYFDGCDRKNYALDYDLDWEEFVRRVIYDNKELQRLEQVLDRALKKVLDDTGGNFWRNYGTEDE